MGATALSQHIHASAALERDRDKLAEELDGELFGLRQQIVGFVERPDLAPARVALARRLRALSARCAGLSLQELAEELSSCEGIVQATSLLGELDDADRAQLLESLDRIDAEVRRMREREVTPVSAPLPSVSHGPAGAQQLGAVVIGPRALARTLAGRGAAEGDGLGYVIEHIAEADGAQVLVYGMEPLPRVIVVDADDAHADQLVEWLLGDAATEDIPIVVVGSWEGPVNASRFIALGVARSLAKPVSTAGLRRACAEVASGAMFGELDRLGTTTLDELGVRLAAELQKGLCDAAEAGLRSRPIELGDGADVLSVMSDAVTQIRELVTIKSAGEVRFHKSGLELALPQGSWLTRSARRAELDRAPPTGEVRREGPLSLDGFSALVAEGDLSTSWFLSGVLREAQADVHDAMEGSAALDHAFRHVPDVILADVVMPGLDGFALCQAVKRDVLLGGTPVILLAWKNDLLQRMRELGAPADGYLLKESTSATVRQRVVEVMRPRLTVAERIERGGTVRGRLDALTPYALLRIACRTRPDSRVTIRDACDLFEIDIRDGRPVRASRSFEGGSQCGPEALAALVGVTSGRFGVQDADGYELPRELDGSLDELLRGTVARVRAAQELCSGLDLLRVGRVMFDEAALQPKIASTPEPARGLYRALVAGASPAELVRLARASTDMLERVLADAARRGAIIGVCAHNGEDRLPGAVARELALSGGSLTRADLVASPAPPALPVVSPEAEPVEEGDEELDEPDAHTEHLAPVEERASLLSEPPLADEEVLCDRFVADVALIGEEADLPVEERISLLTGQCQTEAARISVGPMQVDELSVSFGPMQVRSDTPILASRVVSLTPSATPRVSVDFDVAESEPEDVDVQPGAEILVAATAEETPAEAHEPPPEPRRAERSELADELRDRRRARAAEPRRRVEPSWPDEPESARADETEVPKLPRLPMPMPSSYATRPLDQRPPDKPGASRYLVPIVFATIGVSLAVGARWFRQRDAAPPPAMAAPAPPPPIEEAVPAPAPETAALPTPTATPTATHRPPEELPVDPRDKAKLKPGEGLLEVVAGQHDKIYVDGRAVGDGPVQKVPVKGNGEPHEVRVKLRGEERVRYVLVKPGVRVRLRVAPPWSR